MSVISKTDDLELFINVAQDFFKFREDLDYELWHVKTTFEENASRYGTKRFGGVVFDIVDRSGFKNVLIDDKIQRLDLPIIWYRLSFYMSSLNNHTSLRYYNPSVYLYLVRPDTKKTITTCLPNIDSTNLICYGNVTPVKVLRDGKELAELKHTTIFEDILKYCNSYWNSRFNDDYHIYGNWMQDYGNSPTTLMRNVLDGYVTWDDLPLLSEHFSYDTSHYSLPSQEPMSEEQIINLLKNPE